MKDTTDKKTLDFVSNPVGRPRLYETKKEADSARRKRQKINTLRSRLKSAYAECCELEKIESLAIGVIPYKPEVYRYIQGKYEKALRLFFSLEIKIYGSTYTYPVSENSRDYHDMNLRYLRCLKILDSL